MREWNRDGSATGAPSGGAILLVDANAGTRRELAREMRGLGMPVVEASSPLEAIDALDRETAGIETVVVAPTVSSTPQAELARFIVESYPAVSQVLVRGQHWHEGKADHRWLLFDLQGELVRLPPTARGGEAPGGGAVRRRRVAKGSGRYTAVKSPLE